MGTIQGQMRVGGKREVGVVGVICALLLVAVACAPPEEPSTPTPDVRVVLSLASLDPPVGFQGLVRSDVTVRDVPDLSDADITWTYRDLATGAIVHTEQTTGDPLGDASDVLQPGLFQVSVDGSTASINVEVSVDVVHEGVSRSGSTARTLTWTAPASPITGSLDAVSSYTVATSTYTACAPVGTELRIDVDGETSGAFVTFMDFTGSGFGTIQPVGSDDHETLVTTDPCWSVGIGRASFAGDLAGTMTYTVSWPVGPGAR